MGIHCQCPNGHTLNLKSFLAGKRGICPQCQAKFIIPRQSASVDPAVAPAIDPMVESVRIQTTSDQTTGNPESALPPLSAAAGSGSASVAVSTAPRTDKATAQAPATPATVIPATVRPAPATETTTSTATSTAPAAASPADPTAWYVRLESGEKFGPADTKTLRAWSDEGRVPPGALLWREGWDGWHKAETVFTGAPIVAPADDAQPAAGQLATGQLATGPSSRKASASSWAEHNFPLHNDEPHVQTEGRHDAVTLKRRRRGESRKVAAITIMALLLVVMVPVLMLVVFR